MATIGAAVNDCWGLAQVGDCFSLHCLGKRHVEAGTEWLLERDAEDYWWGLKEVTDGLKPLEMVDAKQRIVEFLHQEKAYLTAKAVQAIFQVAVGRPIAMDLKVRGVFFLHPHTPPFFLDHH